MGFADLVVRCGRGFLLNFCALITREIKDHISDCTRRVVVGCLSMRFPFCRVGGQSTGVSSGTDS